MKFLRQPEPRKRVLTEDEEGRLLESSSGHLRPSIVIALHTGMRKAEIVNFERDQVDMKNREIEVMKTKSGKRRELFQLVRIYMKN